MNTVFEETSENLILPTRPPMRTVCGFLFKKKRTANMTVLHNTQFDCCGHKLPDCNVYFSYVIHQQGFSCAEVQPQDDSVNGPESIKCQNNVTPKVCRLIIKVIRFSSQLVCVVRTGGVSPRGPCNTKTIQSENSPHVPNQRLS